MRDKESIRLAIVTVMTLPIIILFYFMDKLNDWEERHKNNIQKPKKYFWWMDTNINSG